MAVFAIGLVTPGVAVALVHSGRIVFPEPRNPPSIGVPPPPADQAREDDREVVIRYDASLGTVTFSAEVWDPSYWGEKYYEGFSMGSKCKEGPLSDFGPSEFVATVKAQPKERGLAGRNGAGSRAKPPCAATPAMSKARVRSTANGLRSRSAAAHSATGTGAAWKFTNPR